MSLVKAKLYMYGSCMFRTACEEEIKTLWNKSCITKRTSTNAVNSAEDIIKEFWDTQDKYHSSLFVDCVCERFDIATYKGTTEAQALDVFNATIEYFEKNNDVIGTLRREGDFYFMEFIYNSANKNDKGACYEAAHSFLNFSKYYKEKSYVTNEGGNEYVS